MSIWGKILKMDESYTNRHAIVCVGTILKELTCLLRPREFCCFCPVQAHYVNVWHVTTVFTVLVPGPVLLVRIN